jgi:hypothetical protein
MARLVLAWPGRHAMATRRAGKLGSSGSPPLKIMQAHKPKTKPETTNTSEPELDRFQAILDILNIEDLIRFRRRLEKVGRKRMVEILSDEINERQALEKKEAEKEHANRVRSTQR